MAGITPPKIPLFCKSNRDIGGKSQNLLSQSLEKSTQDLKPADDHEFERNS
jgi:hypothetical protein